MASDGAMNYTSFLHGLPDGFPDRITVSKDGVIRSFIGDTACMYVPAKTCRMTDARWDNGQCTWGCICSACDAHLEYERGRYLNYCPRCGARVEEASDDADR